MQKKDYSILLTPREIEILKWVVEGWSNQQIADELSISIRTVKFHTSNIYDKLEVHTRAQAISRAWKNHNLQRILQN